MFSDLNYRVGGSVPAQESVDDIWVGSEQRSFRAHKSFDQRPVRAHENLARGHFERTKHWSGVISSARKFDHWQLQAHESLSIGSLIIIN